MNAKKDAAAGLTLAAAVLMAIAIRSADRWRPQIEHWLAETKSELLAALPAPALALTLTLALAVTITLRVVAVRRALRNRVAYAALPADSFDPDSEEISRFAFSLARLRRPGRRKLDRPAAAARVRLDSVPEGRMLYLLEAPAHARSVLRTANYDQVELRELDTLDLPGLAVAPDSDSPELQILAPGPMLAPDRPATGEPPDPSSDDPRPDIEHDWLKEDRW